MHAYLHISSLSPTMAPFSYCFQFAMHLSVLLFFISPERVSSSTSNFTDLMALLAVKSHITSDPGSVISTTWITNTSFCGWTGVSCSLRRQRVTSLQLKDLSLEGTVAPQIANLSFLVSLDLSNNTLGGGLPDGLGALPRLKFLNLSGNQFSGEMPPLLFNSTSLQSVDLGINKLSGGIPDELYLPQLQLLSLSQNQITGRIPTSLGHCYNLHTLILLQNEFVGTIPMELENLSNLRILNLGDNNLTGSIPPFLGNLTALQLLTLSTNNLEGYIPHELGRLDKLQLLNLGENSLTGTTPSSIFNISSLEKLSLAFNRLAGQLPPGIGFQLPSLQGLYISENLFSGEVPSSLANASMLSILEFSDNLLSGSVPRTLGDLEFLETLSLQGNQLDSGLGFISSLTRCRFLENLLIGENSFGGHLPEYIGNLSTKLLRLRAPNCQLTGEIPASLGNLSSLIYLNLHDNQLSGAIPPEIARLENLQLIYLYINRLEGSVPEELCRLTSLYVLFLYENMLSGPIPDCLHNISRLERLSLAANNLSSVIPSRMWDLTDLYFLNLSQNSLVGSLSSEVGNLKALGQLDLFDNQLTGTVPSTIGHVQMLKYLILSQNSFLGPIPESFGHLINMEGMDLSSNALTGTIPKSLANLSYLSFLNLSFNRLEGEVPHGGVFANLTAEFIIGNKALCGEPNLGLPPCESSNLLKSNTRLFNILKYGLPTVFCLVIALAFCFYFLLVHRKKLQVLASIEAPALVDHRLISYQEVVRATENFSAANLIGAGSHGSVYKGILDDGMVAAIKVLDLHSEEASKSFDAECEVMRNVRHRNLVKIISTCSNLDFKALVLQLMPNGSLDRLLHSEDCTLTLSQRTNILLDASLALEYLHHEHSEAVVHCDVKPGNVLLDDNMTAHVSDFGISKLLASGKSIAQSSAPGTIGYMAPEYGLEGRVSTKGDVYSFGILILETITGKKPTDQMFAGNSSLRQWVNDAFPDSMLNVLDSNLLHGEGPNDHQSISLGIEYPSIEYQCLSSLMELGLACSKELPKERISMRDAQARLTRIKMQLNAQSTMA